ncbi:MAG: MFS transporter [Sphingopyxis sp.]
MPQRTQILYGMGAIAYGIKDNGFSVFLLLFYNQIIGLDAGQVGFILLLALLFDALIDPLVGHLSDRTRTRWGRRHPWLYASAIPIAVTWLLLWQPPMGTGTQTLGWLLLFATLLRMSLSLNEVPSIALAPEMTADYHERTSVLGWRYLFGWAGGLAMLAAAYGVFQLGDPALATKASFAAYAVAGGVVMLVSVLVSAVDTHRRFARPLPGEAHQPTFADMLACLKYRPFLILILTALFAFANPGLTFTLSSYLLGYVWTFGWQEQVIYSLCLFAGVLAALVLARVAGRRFGKRGTVMRLTLLASSINAAPYILNLIGLFPTPGTTASTALFLPIVTMATACSVASMVTSASMMADVTTAHQAVSGKKQEGVFYAGWTFMQKCVTGLGIFLSGQILVLIAFPARANPATISPQVVADLALVYTLATLTLAAATAWAVSRYDLGAPLPQGNQ